MKWIAVICLVAAIWLSGCRTIIVEKHEYVDGELVAVFKGGYEVVGDQKFSNFKMEVPGKFKASFDQEAKGAGIETAIDATRDFIKLIDDGKLVTPNE